MKRADFFRHLVSAVMLPGLVWVAGSGCGRESAGSGGNAYAAVGQVMAQKTAELCGGKGGIVMVTCQDENGNPVMLQIADAFKKSLGPGMQIAGVEKVNVPLAMSSGMPLLSADKLQELLGKYGSADCLVSFVGVPDLTAAQIDQLPSPRPKVVAAVAFSVPSPAMFGRKVVYLAAVPKPAAEPTTATGESAQAEFDAQYQLVTPDSVGTPAR